MVADHGPSPLGPAPPELSALVGPTLTHCAVQAIWRVLEAYGAMPLNYTCRLLAQTGLVPRLFNVLKQVVSLQLVRRGTSAAAVASSFSRPSSYQLPKAGQAPLFPRHPNNTPQQSLPPAVATAAAAGAAATPRSRIADMWGSTAASTAGPTGSPPSLWQQQQQGGGGYAAPMMSQSMRPQTAPAGSGMGSGMVGGMGGGMGSIAHPMRPGQEPMTPGGDAEQ